MLDKPFQKYLDDGPTEYTLPITKGEDFTFVGRFMTFSNKRSSDAPDAYSATLRLYERHKPSSIHYVLHFEKRDVDGVVFFASMRTASNLDRLARTSPQDKLHRRIFQIAGALDSFEECGDT